MTNLATRYRNQGRWKAAEELEVKVIETSLRVRGADSEEGDISYCIFALRTALRERASVQRAEKVRLYEAQLQPVCRLTHTALVQGFNVINSGAVLLYLTPSVPKTPTRCSANSIVPPNQPMTVV